MKSEVPTPGELWNSLWPFASALFLHGFQRQRLKSEWRSHGGKLEEVTWGKIGGTEIANDETIFGNSVKTSGTLILYLTPALGEGAGRLT